MRSNKKEVVNKIREHILDSYSIVEKEKNYFNTYDDGYYTENHTTISIVKKEVNNYE